MRCQDPISTVILAQKVLELFENPIVDSLKMDLEKLGKGSKKNLEFSRFSGWVGLKKPIFQKKNMLPKCILGHFKPFW